MINNKQKYKTLKMESINKQSQKKKQFNYIKYIEQYDLDDNYIKTWESAYTAAKELGFNSRQILLCCYNKAKSHKKYKWKLKNVPDIQNEYWKELKGELKGLSVSNLGRYQHKDECKLYGHLSKNGELMVYYNKHEYNIATLILIAFKGNPYNDLYIPYHYDGDVTNNNINNLFWVVIFNVTDILNFNDNLIFNMSAKPIKQYKNKVLINTYDSIYDASKKTNISAKLIFKCAEGINNIAGGFNWTFDNDPDLIDEVWKKHPILDINVSNMGRILTLNGKSYGILNENLLFKYNDHYVHILVAETFIENNDNYNYVEHLNNNKQNNCVFNLNWTYCDDNLL